MSSLLDDLDALLSDEDELIVVKPTGTRRESPSEAVFGGASTSILGTNTLSKDAMSDFADFSDEEDGMFSDEGADEAGSRNEVGTKIVVEDNEFDDELERLGKRSAIKGVARLADSNRFQEHMKRIERALTQVDVPEVTGPLEEWPEYQLLVQCNKFLVSIDDELHDIFNYLLNAYKKRFPELSSILPTPNDYVRAVKVIQNNTDYHSLDFSAFLSPSTVMVLQVSLSSSAGILLTKDELEDVMDGITAWENLQKHREELIQFMESRMSFLAPNLSYLLGTRVASQLIGIVGGLNLLSLIPACNIQVIGQKRRTTGGLAATARLQHAGLIYQAPVVESAPVEFKRKTAKALADKIALASRVDLHQTTREVSVGTKFLKDIQQKLERWQAPPPSRKPQPLKAPDDRPSRKRGGRRARALKEKYGMTETRKELNKISMTGNAEYGDSSMGLDMGMLQSGVNTSGRLRIEQKPQKNVFKRQRMAMQANAAKGGTLSTFAFTPVQGIELVNPQLANAKEKTKSGTATDYFSSTGTFSMIRK